jgi:hypothetical protein
MTVSTVTIGSDTYDVYVTNAEANTYHNASLATISTDWLALTTDQQNRSIVMATRILDGEDWAGQKTSSSQALEHPRTGLTTCDGVAVGSSTLAPGLEDATSLLAAILADDPTALDSPDSGSNIKRAKAGEAEVEFHVPTQGRLTRFPKNVHNLVGCYLEGANLSSGFLFGGDTTLGSAFDTDEGFGLTEGLP